MTETPVDQSSSGSSPIGTTRSFDISADPVLLRLVDLANGSGDDFEFGITLNVQGSLVTGIMIGANTWLDAFAAEYRAGSTTAEEGRPTLADSLRDGFRLRESDYARGPAGHIHLKDAQMVTGDRLGPADRKVLWRGRMAAVSGWCMGVMARR
jgi:hypothetical protein